MNDDQTSQALERALRLAELGWPVLPVHPLTHGKAAKKPYKDFGWRDLATTDAETIRAWWLDGWTDNDGKLHDLADALVAICPGEVGITVVDFDAAKGDTPSGMETAADNRWHMSAHVEGPSISGTGKHLYYRGVRSSAEAHAPGIDIRSRGGYVVVNYELPAPAEIWEPLPLEYGDGTETGTRAGLDDGSGPDLSADEYEQLYGRYRALDQLTRSQLRLLRNLNDRREVDAFVRRETERDRPVPTVYDLDEWLKMPRAAAKYAVSGLLPRGGKALIEAYYKAGKSTLNGNLIRAYAGEGFEGGADEFLGAFAVPEGGSVGLLDNELPEDTLWEWLRDQHISTTRGRVRVMPAAGRASLFDFRDDRARDRIYERIGDVDALILDTATTVVAALGIDNNNDVLPLLQGIDAYAAEHSVREVFVFTHMGHYAERAKGSADWGAWPDAIWKLTLKDGDHTKPRWFSAFGRDVAVDESQLMFDPATRHLTIDLASGARKKAPGESRREQQERQLADDINAVLDFLRGQDAELSGIALKAAMKAAAHGGNVLYKLSAGRTDKALAAIRDGNFAPWREDATSHAFFYGPGTGADARRHQANVVEVDFTSWGRTK